MENPGSIADNGVEDVAQAAGLPLEANSFEPVFLLKVLERAINALGKDRESIIEVLGGSLVLGRRKEPEHGAEDRGDVSLLRVNNAVRARIVGVGGPHTTREGVEHGEEVNNEPGEVVHVKDWRVGVKAGGMELVAVLHGGDGELLKVALHNGVLHLLHPL